ncbi:zinc finger protein 26-like [Cydia amplana]|uniref:zinc finger protein 26-like n=1 Tax=Cydia amplana TaxID=1869771 RepID=UPI002FE566EA
MEEPDFVGCVSCMSTTDLYDLFAAYSDNVETYAKMLETCFDLKVLNISKYICAVCSQKLEEAVVFKEQTLKNISMLQTIKDEEYLDESILEEADAPEEVEPQEAASGRNLEAGDENEMDGELDEQYAIQALDETTCIYCDLTLSDAAEVEEHVRSVHGLEPRTGLRLQECNMCGATLTHDVLDHINRCHGASSGDTRRYPCHFCDNIYTSRKACYTHLRMKHGLKLSNDQTPKYTPRERKKCHICDRDFSQKQILNKHLWKVHGYEVEKRKAFLCPLCPNRVSYGAQFSRHLLTEHRVREHVERLHLHSMDEFMLFKSAIQEETKYRFRKTTASKQTIEGVRSHYMCSQSGVYVCQGKGKRPAPERQIYKTGKACPAHMIVTETTEGVLVTFHKTHVGHGPCPYYQPRETKKPKTEAIATLPPDPEPEAEAEEAAGFEAAWICDSCGMAFVDASEFREHVATHGLVLFPCQYCESVFQNLEAWSRHLRIEHNVLLF